MIAIMDNTSIQEQIAKIIIEQRKCGNISQSDLAEKLSINTVHMCRIETGRLLPHEKTLSKIENALGIPGQLTALRREHFRRSRQAAGKTPAPTSLVPIHPFFYYDDQDARRLFEPTAFADTVVYPELQKYKHLEDRLELPHGTRLAVLKTFNQDAADAQLIASMTRYALGAGDAPLPDLIPLLEAQNVRILFTDRLPTRLKSASFYDTESQTLAVCLNRATTPEGQLYGLAKELGYAAIHLSTDPRKAKRTQDRTPPFVRAFASALLMPPVAIASLVDLLHIGKREWTLDLICQLKWRFGVSAETFALRLEELGKIDTALLDQIISEIKTHYREHPERPEPGTVPAHALPQNTWLTTLTARAKAMQFHSAASEGTPISRS